jgi:hypothetical protein
LVWSGWPLLAYWKPRALAGWVVLANIPKFDIAQKSINFYCWYLAEHEDQAGDLRELRPSALNLTLGYEQCKSDAEAVYSRLLNLGAS